MKEDRRDRRSVEDLLKEDNEKAMHLRDQNLAGINETAEDQPDKGKQDWDDPDPNEEPPVRRRQSDDDEKGAVVGRRQAGDDKEKETEAQRLRRQADELEKEARRLRREDDDEPKDDRKQDDDDKNEKSRRRQDDEEKDDKRRKQDDEKDEKTRRRQDDEEKDEKRRKQDDDKNEKSRRRQDDDEPKDNRKQDDDEEKDDRKQDDDPDQLENKAKRLRRQALKKKEECEEKRRKADSIDMECRALRRQAESDDDDVPIRRKQDAKDEMIEKAAKLRRLRREAEDDEAEAAEARKQADKCEKDARRLRRQETETSQDDYAGSFGGKQDDDDKEEARLREDMENAAEKMAAHAIKQGSDQSKEKLKEKFLAGMEKMQAKNKDKGRKQDDDDPDDDDKGRKQDDDDDPPPKKRRGDDENFPKADGRKQGDEAPDAVLDSVSANEDRYTGPEAAALRNSFVREGTNWVPPTLTSPLHAKLGDDYQRLIDEVATLPWVQVLERKDYREVREAYVRIVGRPRVDESGNKVYSQVYLFEDPETKGLSARWMTGRCTYSNGREFKTVDDVIAWLGMPSRLAESKRYDLDRRAQRLISEDFNADSDKWFDDLAEVSGDITGPVKAAILKLVQGPCIEITLNAMEAEVKKLPPKPQKALLAQIKAIREDTYKREFKSQFGGHAGSTQGNSQVSNLFDLIRQAVTYSDSNLREGSDDVLKFKTDSKSDFNRIMAVLSKEPDIEVKNEGWTIIVNPVSVDPLKVLKWVREAGAKYTTLGKRLRESEDDEKVESRKQSQRLRREAEEFEDTVRRLRRQAEDAEAEARNLRRQADDKEEEAQKKRRKGMTEGKDDDEAEAKKLHRKADEEEQEARRMRRKEDEAEAEAKRLRRQADDKDDEAEDRKADGETVRLRRQADDKEVESRRALREAEEEKIDAQRLRRKADDAEADPGRKQGNEEELKPARLRKQADEKDTKCDQLRKQAEEAESEARRLRRQADDEEETAKRKDFGRQDSGKKGGRSFDREAPGRKADDDPKDANEAKLDEIKARDMIIHFKPGTVTPVQMNGIARAATNNCPCGASVRNGSLVIDLRGIATPPIQNLRAALGTHRESVLSADLEGKDYTKPLTEQNDNRFMTFTEGKLSAAFDSNFQAAFVSDRERGVSFRATGSEQGLASAYRKISKLFDDQATFKTVMEALHGHGLKMDAISLDESLWTNHAAYSLCSHRDADDVIEESLFGDLKVEKALIETVSEEAAPKDIKVTNPGVLEIPEGKKFEDMPNGHFEKLIKSKGQKAVMLALLNLERWNKDKNAPVASRARALIDKFKEEEKR